LRGVVTALYGRLVIAVKTIELTFRIDNVSRLALSFFYTLPLSPDSVLVPKALPGGKRWNSGCALQTPSSLLSGCWESANSANDRDVLFSISLTLPRGVGTHCRPVSSALSNE
jgi:hypothetical protein